MNKKFRGFVVTDDGSFTIAITDSYGETLNEMHEVRLLGFECYIQEILE